MAIITRRYLIEQIRSLLSGGDPSAGSKYEPRIIMSHLQNIINTKLKSEYFNVTLPSDETIPDGLVLATYDSVPVESYKDRSRSRLPAQPIGLRRGMGIFHVSLIDDLDNPFIPLQSGQNAFIKSQNFINDLFGQIGYEAPSDGYITYTVDLTKLASPISEVFMRLVVMDFDKYDDFDMLPLTADMAEDVVNRVVALLNNTPPPDKKVDSKTEEVPQQRPVI